MYSACLQINFIKICPEITLKYFFEINVILYEIYSKKSKVTNTNMSMDCISWGTENQ
jgi:hypothetical protein